jgi:hypothetical protein
MSVRCQLLQHPFVLGTLRRSAIACAALASSRSTAAIFDRHFTPFLRQLSTGSNSFPEASLLVEPIEFEAAEIIARHDPDDFTAVDNRHVAVTAVFH